MKVIVTGSQGMLSQDLIPIISTEHETVSLAANELDITNKEKVFDVIGESKADLVINCAAYSQVDQAETEIEQAFRINAYGVQQLALACRQHRSTLCHISTDYVFDGTKNEPYQPFDQPNPISRYGASKLAGEKFVQSILNRYYLIRTSSLYGKNGNNFVHTILQLAKKGGPLKVVCDQQMSPTWTVNLAQGILRLISTGNFGTYHLTDRTNGGISWHEFAGRILERKGNHAEIEPITTKQFARPAKRPAYSVLDTSLFTLCSGYEPLPWEESLKRFLETI
ncbi:MAG: dTDP-4-dehydrorhamnose reductase [Deltaproteobacteria bacterium]|nr:dTDP-4-dehydrorhamnose reductase [Deltaproteobacteria bacterium]MBW2317412.1 dTDP-4-dehydrorhamnose reductase [Deltaproteobacteria bacterium]